MEALTEISLAQFLEEIAKKHTLEVNDLIFCKDNEALIIAYEDNKGDKQIIHRING